MISLRLLALAGVVLLAACGNRPAVYDKPIGTPQVIGLVDRVAVVDPNANRAVMLVPRENQEVDRVIVPLGKGVLRAAASADGKRLIALSTGDVPRRKQSDERPSLAVVEGTVARRLPLESPHSGLSLDPLGRYAAIFAAPGTGSGSAFVENPNEIVIVDLAEPDDLRAVVPRTIRSFGGTPQRISFTPKLSLPGGERRLLVLETEQDIVLLDLDHLHDATARPEITVRLTNGASAKTLNPAAVVFDDGDPKQSDDARIGVRLTNDPSVVTLTLGAASPGSPNDFLPSINLSDAGGIPSDLAFVRTDAGLRLAAMVPGIRSAVLIDPSTSITTTVSLSEAFSRISLITNVVGAAGSDVALLYGTQSATTSVAFWALARAVGQSYRSVELVSLGGVGGVTKLLDVPPPQANLKVLQTSGNAFFVLDLQTRTAPPLTTHGSAQITVAPDGQRLWVYQRGTAQLAVVSLLDLHPIQLPLDRNIDAVFDVARPGGRALLAVDVRGAVGVTALDALLPDATTSRSYYGILLEGLQ
jgi:hypothetical protein